MQKTNSEFDIQDVLHRLKHYLPSQSPLKDFIHHNTLHAFQSLPFHNAMYKASEMFGYQVYLQLDTFRNLYLNGKISETAVSNSIAKLKGKEAIPNWTNRMLYGNYVQTKDAKIGSLRAVWKTKYKINLDKITHPTLFRLLNNYLDQGISINGFPVLSDSFFESLKALEKNSFVSFFKSKLVKQLLSESDLNIEQLLQILIGDKSLFEHYLFDMLFAHVGWSGMVSVIEDSPNALFDKRNMSLSDLIKLELLLEIDALETKFKSNWLPLAFEIEKYPEDLFELPEKHPVYEILSLWQEAYEWTYYSEVLKGIQKNIDRTHSIVKPSFHAFFCIDDRECSFRRYIEVFDPGARTYGTPGFFNAEFYFQPEHSKFYTKVCPAPLSPNFIIKEKDNTIKRETDVQYSKHAHSLISGWLISQTLGFWSALRLFFNIFKPGIGPATTYSFRHMDKKAGLEIEFKNGSESTDGLQAGYTVKEMTDRMEGLLKSIGLTSIQTPLVYFVGHGASSINNTYYAGYDCGACSGRPGSVNARVAASMCNNPEVRKAIAERGIAISEATLFIGALHDTTRDEIEYYDIDSLSSIQQSEHQKNADVINKALDSNAKERSRKFYHSDTKSDTQSIHEKIKLRSVSLFEPRPELNHANNALCIVGSRELTKNLFLDRRAFLNSYDYSIDTDGKYLLSILKAVAPVCGGINLEYYFSRVDNQKLGAGTKLPHNVMGLIGVANGTDGDLRTGLPLQMIELHDPIRLMVLVESLPEKVLDVIQRSEQTYEWFENEWIRLLVLHPTTHSYYLFEKGKFKVLDDIDLNINVCKNLDTFIEETEENLPVMLMEEAVV